MGCKGMHLQIIHLSIVSAKAERTKGGGIGCSAHFAKKSRGQVVSFFGLLHNCGFSQQIFRLQLNISLTSAKVSPLVAACLKCKF